MVAVKLLCVSVNSDLPRGWMSLRIQTGADFALSLFNTQQRVGVLKSKSYGCFAPHNTSARIVCLSVVWLIPLFCYLCSLFSLPPGRINYRCQMKSEVFSLDPVKSARHKTQLSLSTICHYRCIGDHSTSQEWWTRMFWRVILSLSVMVQRGVAH